MSKLFKEWMQKTVNEYHNKPGMLTGRLHFLTNYNAQKGAMLAWNHQQEKIDALLEALELLTDYVDERSGDNECRPLENARAAIAKAKGQTK